MKSRGPFLAAMLVVLAAALALRLPGLAQRPMHTDEAVQAVKFGILWRTGTYHYDPKEYHGPTLYYFTLPAMWLSGRHDFAETNESTFRVVPSLFGAGLVPLLFLLADGLRRRATICAAVLTAVSPAMVFYSRYYIQETLLVFFTFALIGSGWRYARTGRTAWCLLAGASLGLMYATKETWVVAVACLLAAAVLTVLWTRWRDAKHMSWRHLIKPRVKARALILGWAVSALLFSAFFTNLRGPLDALLAYRTYLPRGGGESTHVHPWRYYLSMLLFTRQGAGPAWSEALILGLALVGIIAALWLRGAIGAAHISLIRFLTFYTLTMTAVYCAIPYKTPWCLLGFLHGMILLAGVGAVVLLRSLPGATLKALAGVALVLAVGQLARQAYAASFIFYADRRNPYVYAQTASDVLHLAARAEDLARVHPEGHRMRINTITDDYWPLPWYLRRFQRVGYWQTVSAAPDAPLILTSPRLEAALEQRLRRHYHKEYFGLRPEVFITAYVDDDLWNAFLRQRAAKTRKGAPR